MQPLSAGGRWYHGTKVLVFDNGRKFSSAPWKKFFHRAELIRGNAYIRFAKKKMQARSVSKVSQLD
jgi:hypothetical protein